MWHNEAVSGGVGVRCDLRPSFISSPLSLRPTLMDVGRVWASCLHRSHQPSVEGCCRQTFLLFHIVEPSVGCLMVDSPVEPSVGCLMVDSPVEPSVGCLMVDSPVDAVNVGTAGFCSTDFLHSRC
jgi:hypothetical protein